MGLYQFIGGSIYLYGIWTDLVIASGDGYAALFLIRRFTLFREDLCFITESYGGFIAISGHFFVAMMVSVDISSI